MDDLTAVANDERSARIALATIATPGDPLTGRVLTTVGAVETVRLLADDAPVPGLDKIEAGLWRGRLQPRVSANAVHRALDRSERQTLHTLIPGDEDYPDRLGDLGHRAPYLLWARGNAELLSPFAQPFAITGTSYATTYGTRVATELASELLADNSVLVAGGSAGIDAAVHQAALDHNGGTIAVVTGELDSLDWHSGEPRLREIADRGLLLSETPPGVGPSRERFLSRLRIEAALSGSVTIVEARQQSDALQIVDRAQELGLPVSAVPGPVFSPVSEAPNVLIRDGRAEAVLNANDLWDVHHSAPEPQQRQLTTEPPTQSPTRPQGQARGL